MNAVITNKEILALAKSEPKFEAWTSKLTKDTFDDAGYESYAAMDNTLKGDFWNLLVQTYMLEVRGPEIRIPQTFQKVVSNFANPSGGQGRKIRTKLMKPTDPRYRNLVANGSVDPFVIRPLVVEEEYYKQNFDYANNMTITDTDIKKMFQDSNGISTMFDRVFNAFEDAKRIQEYNIVEEVFSKMLTTSTRNPLQATQQVEVPEIVTSGSSQSDNDTQADFVSVFKNFKAMMETTVFSKDFNCQKFEHSLIPDNYVLFVRAEIINYINTHLMANSYHTENLGIPFEIVPVKNFGGITYKKSISGTEKVMKPCYSTGNGNLGEVLGYNETGDPTATMYQVEDCIAVDPYPLVDAVLVEKGALFMTEQNPYQVGVIYNPAGLYTNYWASQPNRGLNYDGSYDVIIFSHASSSNKKTNKNDKADK